MNDIDEKVCEWCRKTFSRVDPSFNRESSAVFKKRRCCSNECRRALEKDVCSTCVGCGEKLAEPERFMYKRYCTVCKKKKKVMNPGHCSPQSASRIIWLLRNDPGAMAIWDKFFGGLGIPARRTLKSEQEAKRIGRKR